jgi:hypothetical protein
LFDPVPGLVTGFASDFSIDANPTLLSENGTPVTGAAADGVTQLVIMVSNLAASEQITLSLTNPTAGATDDLASGIDGVLKTLLPSDSSPPGPTIQVTAVPVGGSNMAFAVYVPPIDYNRDTNYSLTIATDVDITNASRQVTLQVQDSSGNPLTSEAITIYRPGIMTVNGAWEDKTAWGLAMEATGVFSLSDNQVLPGNNNWWFCPAVYNSNEDLTSASYDLLGQASRCLDDFRSQNKAAAGQLDVVAHGSGGLALYGATYQGTNYQATETYGKGYFHKLITLETPYYGSEYAGYLQVASQDCQSALTKVNRGLVPAVEDTAPQGSWIPAFMSDGLPTSYPKHAMAAGLDLGGVQGYPSTTPQVADQNYVDGQVNEYAPNSACSAVFANSIGQNYPPNFLVNNYFLYFYGTPSPQSTAVWQFQGANDLVTSTWSQLGPLLPYAEIGYGDDNLDIIEFAAYNNSPWPLSVTTGNINNSSGISIGYLTTGPYSAWDKVCFLSDVSVSSPSWAH